MQTKQLTALLTTGALGLLLTIGGAWAMRAELRPYLAERTGSTVRVLELANGTTATGLSILSQQQYLFDCRTAMTSIAGRTQPSNIRQALLGNCRNASDEIVTKSPSFSIAWLTGAIAAAEAEDWQGFNERLLRSQITGANEQWIAEVRVALAEDHFTQLSDDVLAWHQLDLKMLLGSERGTHSMAQRYLSEPQFRNRITAILAGMPAEDQKRFVNRLERLSP
jgi:hypothetical protein